MSEKKDKLSPTMQQAIDFAQQHGDCLVRHPGGFWADDEWRSGQGMWFGTSTVEALVQRGKARYVEYMKTGHRPFPIRAELI